MAKKKEVKTKTKVTTSATIAGERFILVEYDGTAERDFAGEHWVKGDVKPVSAKYKGMFDEQMASLEEDKTGKKLGFKLKKATAKKINAKVKSAKEAKEIPTPVVAPVVEGAEVKEKGKEK